MRVFRTCCPPLDFERTDNLNNRDLLNGQMSGDADIAPVRLIFQMSMGGRYGNRADAQHGGDREDHGYYAKRAGRTGNRTQHLF